MLLAPSGLHWHLETREVPMKRNWTVVVVVLALLTWIGTVLGIKPDDPKVKPKRLLQGFERARPVACGGMEVFFSAAPGTGGTGR